MRSTGTQAQPLFQVAYPAEFSSVSKLGGKVYDTVLRIVNTASRTVTLTLPSGYTYETFKGATPLAIPANSRNILTVTRTADNVFLVTREELETVQ